MQTKPTIRQRKPTKSKHISASRPPKEKDDLIDVVQNTVSFCVCVENGRDGPWFSLSPTSLALALVGTEGDSVLRLTSRLHYTHRHTHIHQLIACYCGNPGPQTTE